MNVEQLERLRGVAEHWDILGGVSKHVPRKYWCAEALLHEICHAVVLGLSIDRRAPRRIGDKFEEFNTMSNKIGLMAECQVLAVQAHALGILQWRGVSMRKLVHATYENGASGPTSSLKMFLSIYQEFVRDPVSKRYGIAAVDHLHRLARRRT